MTKLTKRFAAPQFPRLVELKRGWKGESAAQIVEFAISLPLLVLLVVGIFDFSNALTLKQRLTNAAREAARVAAADPANDLGSPVPVSIGDAFQVVDEYLVSEKINDCGLAPPPPGAPAAPAVAGLTWTYTANGNGCPGNGITLAIKRGCTTNTGTLYLIGTCITITYAYKWEFNSVANSMGWTASGPSTLTVTAGAFNEN
jgi:Flp pilus assembly protein TadG